MRVLLYVEPFPIRNSMTHFTGIAEKFLPLLHSHPCVDIRLYANQDTLQQISKKRFLLIVPE